MTESKMVATEHYITKLEKAKKFASLQMKEN